MISDLEQEVKKVRKVHERDLVSLDSLLCLLFKSSVDEFHSLDHISNSYLVYSYIIELSSLRNHSSLRH